jgi:serine/threonine protein kinase
MAPEQVRGETCDAQSDLFSLGCVMYALCTGHPPFRAETVYGVMQRVLNDDPRSIVEQNGAIPQWLEQFILRLLEKDKADRFGAAGEVVEELTAELAFLQNPSHAPKPMRRWISLLKSRRKRKPSVFQILAIGACVAGAVWLAAEQFAADTAAKTGDESRVEIQPTPATAQLWQSDGTAQAQGAATAIERQLHAPVNSAANDPWPAEVAEIRRSLQEFSAKEDWRPY